MLLSLMGDTCRKATQLRIHLHCSLSNHYHIPSELLIVREWKGGREILLDCCYYKNIFGETLPLLDFKVFFRGFSSCNCVTSVMFSSLQTTTTLSDTVFPVSALCSVSMMKTHYLPSVLLWLELKWLKVSFYHVGHTWFVRNAQPSLPWLSLKMQVSQNIATLLPAL